MSGIGAEFFNTHELETALKIAGLADSEVDRAILRLEMNHPTFSEISFAAAERLRVIQPTDDASKSAQRDVFSIARTVPFVSGANGSPAILPV